jgi:hypothetical protein
MPIGNGSSSLSQNQFFKLHSPLLLSNAVRAHSHSPSPEAKPASAGWTAEKDHPMNAHIYEQITERIITLLSQGTA